MRSNIYFTRLRISTINRNLVNCSQLWDRKMTEIKSKAHYSVTCFNIVRFRAENITHGILKWLSPAAWERSYLIDLTLRVVGVMRIWTMFRNEYILISIIYTDSIDVFPFESPPFCLSQQKKINHGIERFMHIEVLVEGPPFMSTTHLEWINQDMFSVGRLTSKLPRSVLISLLEK